VRYKYAEEAQKAVDRLDGQCLYFFIHSNCCILLLLLLLFWKFKVINLYFGFFLLGRVVDGREIMVQFAKYGPNAERM